jgi:hypothetical protein
MSIFTDMAPRWIASVDLRSAGKAIFLFLLLPCFLLPVCLPAEVPAADAAHDLELNRIYQFFVPSQYPKARPNSGAYLWIPPATPQIRAVMVGIHNGLPVTILQSPAVRAVCRKYGIAQILLTPNGSEVGPIMLKDLNYDVTDPAKTAVYDAYLRALADVSGHPELVTAPIVPLAHSAYMSFPFEAAMRKPDQCLAALPIKAGMPDVYLFYGSGGKAKTPNPALNLRNVPILFINSASQETVTWSPYPHNVGSVSFLDHYRRDHDDNPGTAYEPQNEMMGMCWDMMCGHFDMLPRDYQFVADWLGVVAQARLPAKPGDPMKNLTLRDGWLVDPQIPATGDLPATYPQPAPYLEFKGPRAKAIWFPSETLARTQFRLMRDEPKREIEMFTFLDPTGQPISLATNALAVMPHPELLLHDDGLFTLTTSHFTAPFAVNTAKRNEPPVLQDILFPGRATLPLSHIPLHFDPNGGPVELVKSEEFKDDRGITETRFTLRLVRYRLAPDSGFTMFFCRAYHEGNREFAAAGRTCQIAWSVQDADPNMTAQTVTFPPVSDAPAKTPKIELAATSSTGLPVSYFVLKGPGLIVNGAFIPTEVPAGATKPIEVTVGAYQVGVFKTVGGIKPSPTVYQTFHLTP